MKRLFANVRPSLMIALFVTIALSTMGARAYRTWGNRYTTGWFKIRLKLLMGDTVERGVEEGCILTRVINKKGSNLDRHEWVIWDDTPISVVDTVVRASADDTLTIACGLGTEGGYMDVQTESYSLAAQCSVEITGEGIAQGTLHGTSTPTASAVVETLLHAATGIVYSTYRWDTLSQIRLLGADANDSIYVNAYVLMGVTTTTDAGDVRVAGVVVGEENDGVLADSITDNTEGWIVTFGAYYAKVTCSSTEGKPGMEVQTSTGAGKGIPHATEVTAAGGGKLLEAGYLDGTYAVFVNCQ